MPTRHTRGRGKRVLALAVTLSGMLGLAGGCCAREPAAVPTAELDYQGLPVGWIDLEYSTHELYLRTLAADCPPCAAETGCPECAHRFHEFAATTEPGASITRVHFTGDQGTLEVGQRYRVDGRLVPWAPFGDVLIVVGQPWPTATEAELAECEGWKDQFRTLLKAAPGTCKTAADCGIAPGGIEGGGCGSVVDRATADRLYELYEQIRPVCGLDFDCAPRAVFPACVGGRCSEGDPGGMVPTP